MTTATIKKTAVLVILLTILSVSLCLAADQPGPKGKLPTPQEGQCRIDGIKTISSNATGATFQVQYYVPASISQPVHIGAYIESFSNRANFNRIPAQSVPKGQHQFTDNIVVGVQYAGTEPYTSKTIELVIYDSNKNLCSTVINWGQQWGPAVTTYVSSCFDEITVDAKISDSFIKSHPGVNPLNYNEVKLHAVGSNVKGDVFECYYGSQNNNLPNTVYNIVYSYPCKNAKKGGTSYQHSFTCTK